MPADLWRTAPPIPASLEKRARKRDVTYRGHNGTHHLWVVTGHSELGDHYDDYLVKGNGETFDELKCDCQGSQGGEFRRRCSHKARVMIWIDEEDARVGIEVEEDDEEVEEELEPEEPKLEPESDPQIRPLPTSITPQQVSDWSPGSLPDKYTEYRVGQDRAILEIVEAFQSGKRMVFLSAPTGAGKTLIGESVRQMLGSSGTYTCTTKSLQRQILDDFDYAVELKGRNNYPTRDDPTVTADACTKGMGGACWTCGKQGQSHCHFCHPSTECPYQIQKDTAKHSPLSVLNMAYLLRETQARRSSFAGKPLYVMDEGDELEAQLMGFIEVTISPRVRRDLGIGMPERRGSEDDWVRWVDRECIPAAEAYVEVLKTRVDSSMSPKAAEVKELNRYVRLLGQFRMLAARDEHGEAELKSGWVMDVSGGGRYKRGGGDANANATIVFKPVKVDGHAHGALWDRNKKSKFLLMSATWVGIESTAEDDLGLDREDYAVVKMDSPFGPERRPVVVDPVKKVVGKEGDQGLLEARKAVTKRVAELLDANPDRRVLIHTHAYKNSTFLQQHLPAHLQPRLHSYSDASARDGALGRFLDDPTGVLLAPSFTRGIDLPHDLCRLIIIFKVPFPYLGDAQINKRLYGMGNKAEGQRWYDKQTIRAICQMTGRGMRAEDDWCVTYILDASFMGLYGRRKTMFPEWWSEALIWDVNDPRNRAVLERLAAEGEVM